MMTNFIGREAASEAMPHIERAVIDAAVNWYAPGTEFSRIVELRLQDAVKTLLAAKSAVKVESLPSWATSTDVVMRRGKRWFLVSLHESEPRWRQLLRWIKRKLRAL